MADYDFEIPVSFRHRIRFTKDAFAPGNPVVAALLDRDRPCKVLVYVETEILRHYPDLEAQIAAYVAELENVTLAEVVMMPGGEACKLSKTEIMEAIRPIERNGIDRHSYVFCIGGGAFLDVIGLAAATAHRGVRLVRFPTTTLSMDDSGVGVKNGINAFGKKNFIGTFAVPHAVVNDFRYLSTLPADLCRGGLVEAVKVALVKDAAFFDWIERHVGSLRALEPTALEEAVERSAVLHARHIAEGGDPFENGSSRPLDFGHWSGHKLEQLTDFKLTHAAGVSLGVALDCLYCAKRGWLTGAEFERVAGVLQGLGLPIWHEGFDLRDAEGTRRVFQGLEEFREHLGGRLTVLMLRGIGRGFDVNELDVRLLDDCMEELKERASAAAVI